MCYYFLAYIFSEKCTSVYVVSKFSTEVIFISEMSYTHLKGIYSLCPKKNVILEILGQIIKEVK
jgi:hypothetical protein